jgi:hypothetical protein
MATERPFVPVVASDFVTAMSTPSAACDWFTATAVAAPLVPVLPFTVKPVTAVAFTFGEIVFWAVLVGACKIQLVQVLALAAWRAYTAEANRRIGSISPSYVGVLETAVPPTSMESQSVSQLKFTPAFAVPWQEPFVVKPQKLPRFTEK